MPDFHPQTEELRQTLMILAPELSGVNVKKLARHRARIDKVLARFGVPAP